MDNLIVITQPRFIENEGLAIARFLDSGAMFVHLRKPGCSEHEMRRLIESVPARYRLRLALHDHLQLAVEYCLGGVHLNSRNPQAPEGFTGRISVSCHTPGELSGHPEADYMFLSPVFSSLSKPGYGPGFSAGEIAAALADPAVRARTFALGGVCPANIAEVRRLGFAGAAMLGAAWNPVDINRFRLQYITHDYDSLRCAPALGALEGGSRWIQLRMKDARAAEIIKAAATLAPACRSYGATFILDDHVELVRATGADGVHLGKNDIPVAQARRLLGPGYIIGATANCMEDIVKAAADGADYIGLGPLRFTVTKKKLSPMLGFEGYSRIISRCRADGINLPIVAIGGITADDIAPLARAGADGIAVSGVITRSTRPAESTETLMKLLKTNYKSE